MTRLRTLAAALLVALTLLTPSAQAHGLTSVSNAINQCSGYYHTHIVQIGTRWYYISQGAAVGPYEQNNAWVRRPNGTWVWVDGKSVLCGPQ